MNRRDALKTFMLGAAGAGVTAGSSAKAADESPAALRKGLAARKILLYSGWAVKNIGDIGHTPGTLRYFSEYLPESQITCWLRKTNDDVTAMLRRRFPKVTFLETGSLDNSGKASTPELQKAFDECDLVVQNSGMHFNRYWQPPVGLIFACKAKNKPFGLYGQSFDGFRPEDAETLPKLLSQASFIFTRDTVSLDFLRRSGVTPRVLEFGPDGCFGIDVRDDAKAAAFMAQHKLEPQRFLVVIIRSDLREITKANDPEAIARNNTKLSGWYGKYIEVITTFVKATGMKVALLPEVEKEIAVAKTEIYDKLPEDVRANVVWRENWWISDEAVSLFSKAHAMVALEPHSPIMALAHGVPAIHYFSEVHGTKAYMFRDIGLSEWLINVDDEPASTVARALERIRADYPLAQSKVKRAMDFVHRRSAEMAVDVAGAKQP